MAVIEVTAAHKTYARFRKPPEKAVDGLDLVVEQGGVHGFLGPNGSGKTTTIRMLLGLVGSDGGDLRLFGRPVPHALPEVIPHVGALVETPLFFPNFTGRLNLRLLADVAGIPATRVEECLEIVALRDRADDRFKGYSLGMKQRLGIAAALLKAPRLLILDEPSNGLDPQGIVDVRELLRRLGSDGHTTVLPVQPPARRGPAGLRPRHDPGARAPGGPRACVRRPRGLVHRGRTAPGRATRWARTACSRPPASG